MNGSSRIIRRLHESEVGKYGCYLCNRGADSYIESIQHSANSYIDYVQYKPATKVAYTIIICRSCVTSHGIKTKSEWDEPQPVSKPLEPAQEAPREEATPELFIDWQGMNQP